MSVLIEANQRKKLTELMKLPFLAETKSDFMPKCTELCKDLVADPRSFCGIFWNDRERWYPKPIQADLKEQIDIFPEFYKRLDNIEAKQAAIQELLVEVLALLRSRVSVLDELDKKELELMNSLAKKIGK